jgi:flagellar biosynthesis/type III secretory pathway protein FliH
MAGAEGTVRTALEEAYERGEADGRAAGAAQAESRVRSAVETLLSAAEAVRAAGEEFTRARARNLQALSLAVAGHLVQREVAADPEILARLTERALELAADDEVEVHLHPEDLALLEPRLSSLAPAGTTPAVRWTGDASMARGGVRVEGPQRLVDGRIETALRSIYERLEYDGHASR